MGIFSLGFEIGPKHALGDLTWTDPFICYIFLDVLVSYLLVDFIVRIIIVILHCEFYLAPIQYAGLLSIGHA